MLLTDWLNVVDEDFVLADIVFHEMLNKNLNECL